MLMFPSVKSQSRYKRSAYVSLSSVFLRARFNPLQFFNALQGRNTISQPDASKPPSNAIKKGLYKCYTTYFQCQSATSKRETLLRLTETEHISFACLIYSDSRPHNDDFHAHSVTLSLHQLANTTNYYYNRNETPWHGSGKVTSQRHKRLRHP